MSDLFEKIHRVIIAEGSNGEVNITQETPSSKFECWYSPQFNFNSEQRNIAERAAALLNRGQPGDEEVAITELKKHFARVIDSNER